ncbi:unnamed protein product [Clavelina lepadiformis]|uniref:Uncharacterized protein n=1 Tax=Clavelina lepadiformis TaxID=159417 RepID=A0ABP0FI67_CLALP
MRGDEVITGIAHFLFTIAVAFNSLAGQQFGSGRGLPMESDVSQIHDGFKRLLVKPVTPLQAPMACVRTIIICQSPCNALASMNEDAYM